MKQIRIKRAPEQLAMWAWKVSGTTITVSDPVYMDTKLSNKIGSLNPWESCGCLGKQDGKYIVKYVVDGTSTYKVGFVSYIGGLSRSSSGYRNSAK